LTQLAGRWIPASLTPWLPSLAHGDLEFLYMARAHDADRHKGSDTLVAEQRDQGVVMGHRMAVQGDDGVAQE
jgi:hypothetical protein